MQIQEPPTTTFGILRKLGPGMILAGSIVGSGELIATTRTGAEAGFHFLWLILLGCVIKVFTQIELARYSISSGQTTLGALKKVPGGRFILFFWLAMFLVGIGQLGGIVGGVGQALAISRPLTAEGKAYNEAVNHRIQLQALEKQVQIMQPDSPRRPKLEKRLTGLKATVAETEELPPGHDDKIWAAIIGIIAILMLALGNFGLIESFSMLLVAGFTLFTIINLFLLGQYPEWSVSWENLREGMRFGFPEARENLSPLQTALATCGIIGVGASELVAYPYWCLEKGYGAWTGPRDGSEAWANRARGWLRVMHWDAWLSMIVYTFSTIAFYLLGAAVLGRTGLLPEGNDLIRTLSVMYEPVFGQVAQTIFLFGAFAVLFSTFFVANAAKTRMAADALNVFGVTNMNHQQRSRAQKLFGIIFPTACVIIYIVYPRPLVLILLAGVMQALLLPMLGFAALQYRYKGSDPRLKPGRLWDIMLWISFGLFVVVGVYLAVSKVF